MISLVIISKNEEHRIGRCLASADFCDEKIILDSGSTDATCEIARRHGARVEMHPFDNHIRQKNRAIELASHEWVLSLDCDEEISPPLRAEILASRERFDRFDGFTMPRLNFHLGRWIRGSGWYPDRKLRLFRKSLGRFGGENPHDRVLLSGRVCDLQGDLLHYAFDSMEEHFQTLAKYGEIASGELFARRRPFRLIDVTARPLAAFLRDYLLRGGMYDGRAGFIICCMNAFAVFYKYILLYERTRQARGMPFHAPQDS